MKITRLIRLFLLIAAFAVVGKTYAQTCPTGMISYWKMDDGESTKLKDYKGVSDATCSGILPDATGILNAAKDFDGASNADIPSNAAYGFNANSSFTIAFWVKIGSSNSGSQIIIGKGDGATSAYWYIGVEDGVPFAVIEDANSNTAYVTSSSAIGANIWHFVVLVRNESGDMVSLYVDGALVDSQNLNFTGSITNSDIITMGYLISNSNPGYFLNGQLDEVAIYSRAFSLTEIGDQYVNASVRGVGYCDALYPNITSTPNNKAIVNSAYSYTVKSSGAKPIAYSLITKPSGMTINSTTGVISWTPTTTNVDAMVSVKAENAYPPADTQTYRIFMAEPASCTDNPLLTLKLNETSGTTYADATGGTHSATIGTMAAPTPTTGKIGGAQVFNSTTGIDIPDNGNEFEWSNSSNFSIEFWMKTAGSGTQVCVSRHRIDMGERIASWFVGTDGGLVTFDLQDNDTADGVNWYTPAIVGAKVINDNQWHHIIAVRNGSASKNQLYVDGALDAEASVSYARSFMMDDPIPVTVGYMLREAGKEPYHYEGIMDEVVIYNRAITASDAANFYANTAGHCAEGNYVPIITSTPVTAATEDAAYSYTFVTEDVDNPTVTLSAVTKPSWLTFNYTAGQKTATLTGTPVDANVGTANVTLRVNDGKTSKDQSFTIEVANINDEPVKTTTPTTSVNEDAAYTYTLTFTDDDLSGDTYSIAAVTLPSWLSLSYTAGTKTATISGTPTNDNTGNNPIDLTYSDGHITKHDTYTLNVVPVNDLPVITGQSALSTDEDEFIIINKSDLTIVDPDNTPTDITITVQPGSHYTVSGTVVTPEADFNGQLAVNVIANDLAGASSPFSLAITVNPVNDPPVITSTPILSNDIDNLYIYLFTASDVDNPTLTKSVVQKPDWLTFSAATGVLTGTPHNPLNKQNLVILRVSDGTIDIDQTFTINVNGATAVSEVENVEFVIYPVPASDNITIKFKSLQEETTVDIINASGSIVKSVIVEANSEISTIPVNELKSGIYFCHVKNSALNYISRIIIN